MNNGDKPNIIGIVDGIPIYNHYGYPETFSTDYIPPLWISWVVLTVEIGIFIGSIVMCII